MMNLKIVFVSSEAVPYAKTGGLADVSGALPRALKKLDLELISFLPFYKGVSEKDFEFELIGENLKTATFEDEFNILEHYNNNSQLKTYFIENKNFFFREEIYDNYSDNPERFIFFCQAVLKSLELINFNPDIIHCHDWQTSAIPIILKNIPSESNFFKDTKILLTIHNLAFQGIGDKEILYKLGLDDSFFVPDKLESYDKINLLKGGILYSDFINTVSERYSEEIQTDYLSFGLKNEISSRREHIFGILNGIDYEIWDPNIDAFIWKKYSKDNIENKNYNKNELLKKLELPLKGVPLIGMVTRITGQKGFDLLIENFDNIMALDLQLIILGIGQPEYHEILKDFAEKYPNKFVLRLEYNDELAHQIQAGSDIFLMPSSFEPCGLNQMISLKYGTIPIVYETGGLADTIKDIRINKNGNGFLFQEYKSKKLYETIKEAIRLYYNKKFWSNLIKKSMEYDFSWKSSAIKYLDLYNKLRNKNGDQ